MKRVKVEDRFNVLFDLLVPPSGNAGTLQGEVIRAINKVVYRYYNDGDKFFEGYGCETAGPAITFLLECPELENVISKEIKPLVNTISTRTPNDEEYEEFLEELMMVGINYVVETQDEGDLVFNEDDLPKTKKPTKLTPSKEDYLEYKSRWEDYDNGEDLWDDDDYDPWGYDDEEEEIW